MIKTYHATKMWIVTNVEKNEKKRNYFEFHIRDGVLIGEGYSIISLQ